MITAAPAAVDSGGRLGAEGWLPEHVRLGILESHLGEGTVESVVRASHVRQLSAGEEPVGRRQRIMSLELLVRLVLLLVMLPEASYVEAMNRLVGPLVRVPWARMWQVPSSTVITAWRRLLPAAVFDASRVGELTLAARLLDEHHSLFTPGHAYVLDRYFGGYDFLHKLHRGGRGAHFAIRMKSSANLPIVQRLGDGEHLSYLRLRDGGHIKAVLARWCYGPASSRWHVAQWVGWSAASSR